AVRPLVGANFEGSIGEAFGSAVSQTLPAGLDVKLSFCSPPEPPAFYQSYLPPPAFLTRWEVPGDPLSLSLDPASAAVPRSCCVPTPSANQYSFWEHQPAIPRNRESSFLSCRHLRPTGVTN